MFRHSITVSASLFALRLPRLRVVCCIEDVRRLAHARGCSAVERLLALPPSSAELPVWSRAAPPFAARATRKHSFLPTRRAKWAGRRSCAQRPGAAQGARLERRGGRVRASHGGLEGVARGHVVERDVVQEMQVPEGGGRDSGDFRASTTTASYPFPTTTTARCDVQYLVSLLPDAFTPAPS